MFCLQVGDTHVGFDVERTASRWGLIVAEARVHQHRDVVVQTEDAAGVIRTYPLNFDLLLQSKESTNSPSAVPIPAFFAGRPGSTREGRASANNPVERQNEPGDSPSVAAKATRRGACTPVSSGADRRALAVPDPQFEYE